MTRLAWKTEHGSFARGARLRWWSPAAILLALVVLLFAGAGPAAARVEMIDMGPAGSQNRGTVWSQIVDEIGNTVGRGEVWRVELSHPARIRFVILSPQVDQLSAVVSFWTADGGGSEYDMMAEPRNRVPGGWQVTLSFDPAHSKDIRVTVTSRQGRTTGPRFIYELAVIAGSIDGPTPGTGPGPGASPTSPPSVPTVPSTGGAPSGGAASGGVASGGAIIGTNPRDPASGTAGADPSAGAGAAAAIRNLARSGTATQSSVYRGTGVDQGPQHGNDGIVDGRDPHDLVLTDPEASPWWMVDLGTVCDIDRVRIFNRRNPDVLANPTLQVLVGNDGRSWRRVYLHDGSRWETLTVPVGAPARFVLLQLAEPGGLQFYEAEVWGRAAARR